MKDHLPPNLKLYRHYKQKYYRLLGSAKHSETLEDLAYYECLYENSSGQFWVRPKELFFGTMFLNGKETPRFAEVQLKIVALHLPADWPSNPQSNLKTPQEELRPHIAPHIAQIKDLHERIFGPWNQDRFMNRLQTHTNPLLLVAHLDDKAVGFKVGYEKSPYLYYSWLGGVLPEFRRFGIAEALLVHQHEWCRQKAYQKIQTKAQNHFKGMLQLNLKRGFDIIGIESNPESVPRAPTESVPRAPKIVLEKSL